jgi:hypothetical protein
VLFPVFDPIDKVPLPKKDISRHSKHEPAP